MAITRGDLRLRTIAQKPSTAGRGDLRLRTLAQKEPVSGGFPHSFGVII